MSIKLRLLFSYIIITIGPLILIVVSAIIILILQIQGVTKGSWKGYDTITEYLENAPKIYGEVEEAINHPDTLLDKSYLMELDSRLTFLNASISLVVEGEVFYASKNIDFDKVIKEYRQQEMTFSISSNELPIVVENTPYSLIYESLQLSDQRRAEVFVITDVGLMGNFAKNFFQSIGIAVLIIVVLCNALITFFVSRSITKPLKKLKYSTQQIKEGNLDFKMEYRAKDEIGDVCIAFEEMRGKLKQSIDTQIQYEENRKELISNISHDLKTPITSIKGYVEGILDGIADTPEKVEKYMKTIYAKANQLDQLIDDLFLFSKLDLKKQAFNFQKLNIQHFFKDCMDELSMELERKGISLSLQADGCEDILVMADQEKLKRVVVNVMDNAAKYMDKTQGHIHIEMLDQQHCVKICIRDNGQGIDPKELGNIFDRFYRADKSRNSATGGTGLGLAISRQIIEGHEGEIWAESAMDQGTTVCFTLKKVEDGDWSLMIKDANAI